MNGNQPQKEPLPVRVPGESTHPGQPSAELIERAQHGWDAFLARTGPLPDEDEQVTPAEDTER
ncbi:hypothetical protein ACWGI8_31935 [Streptomyces sp. NPDC054841]